MTRQKEKNMKRKSKHCEKRAYLVWRCKNLYVGDTVRVAEFVGVGVTNSDFMIYSGVVENIQYLDGEWSVDIRIDEDVVQTVLINVDTHIVCLVRNIDLIREM